MRKRYTHIIIALLFFSIKCWAQLDIGMQNSQPVVPSWENYELMQYGKIGASMYTGTVNYSIPIYTYKDKDFEIPISIDYATNGFRVNHSSGILGHGWSLYTPGVITRQIRGIPDEHYFEVLVQGTIYSTTMYWGFKYLNPGKTYVEDCILGTMDRHNIGKYDTNSLNTFQTQFYETEPDVYTFNFMGFSGKFERRPNNIVGDDGQIFEVFDAEGASRGLKIEVDESGWIVLTDSKGYKYYFWKNEVQEIKEKPELTSSDYFVVSWILKSISAPNGRSVSFLYDPHVNQYSKDYSYQPRIGHYFMYCYPILDITASTNTVIDSTNHVNARLVAINFDDSVKMEFNYSEGDYELRKNTWNHTARASCDNKRLESINLLNGDRLLKSCKFSYVSSNPEHQGGNGNCVTFLKNVNISGEGLYQFDYNNENGAYPYLGTTSYDHWGYSNGRGFPLSGYASYISQDANYDETVIGNVKDPSFSCAKMGTLCRITYPSGGFTTLEYEPHTYSKAVVRNSSSMGPYTGVEGFEPELVTMDTVVQAGGVRIHRIINHLDEDEESDTTTFQYQQVEEPMLSSGILINTPRYGVEYYTAQRIKHVKYYNLANFIFDYDRTHIEYSDVRVAKSGGGSSVYSYSSCAQYDNMDIDYSGLGEGNSIMIPTFGKTYQDHYAILQCEVDWRVTQILTPIPSRQYMRGKLLSEKHYTSGNLLINEISNTYLFPSVSIDTIFYNCGELAKEIYYPRHNIELASTTTTEYNNNTAVSKTEQYEYNRIGLPTVVKTSTSRGDTVVTRNTYVVDTVASTPSLNDQTIIDMADKYLLGMLLSSETHRVNGTTDRLLSAARLTYYRPAQNKPELFCPSTKQEWVSGNNWKTTGQYQFDAMGNLVEVVDEASLTSSYLWSYGSRHMVSTLQNATKAQTETALASVGLHSVDSLARMTYLTSSDFGKVKDLGQQLGSSLQSAWRYRPLVGMTESAPPNHAGATYHYDGYGRLTEIRDDMGKVVGQQEYNIVSVLPMISILHRDSLHLNDGVVAASVTAQGGSGSYSYQWQLADSTGAVLQTGTGSQMSQNLLPGNYTVTFTVADLVSGESATHTWLASVPVRFKNIRSPEPEVKGWTTVLADITLGDAANLAFTVDYAAPVAPSIPNTFKVTIGNQTYNYSGTGLTGIQRWFAAGTTTVSISMYNASQGDATLTLTSAGNLAIGSPDILTFEMGSD